MASCNFRVASSSSSCVSTLYALSKRSFLSRYESLERCAIFFPRLVHWLRFFHFFFHFLLLNTHIVQVVVWTALGTQLTRRLWRKHDHTWSLMLHSHVSGCSPTAQWSWDLCIVNILTLCARCIRIVWKVKANPLSPSDLNEWQLWINGNAPKSFAFKMNRQVNGSLRSQHFPACRCTN